MIGPRGKIQRLDYSTGMACVVYRTRDTRLLSPDAEEWGWSKQAAEAWIFDSYDAGKNADGTPRGTPQNDATAHIAALALALREHSFPVVEELNPQTAEFRRRRHANVIASAEASALRIAPEVTYRETARRLGEHDDT